MGDGPFTVAVKYCGGCNPRYDRVALVRALEAAFPGVRFVPARPGEAGDLLLVVSGCRTACAGLEGLEARLGRFTVRGPEDLPAAAALLRSHSASKEVFP